MTWEEPVFRFLLMLRGILRRRTAQNGTFCSGNNKEGRSRHETKKTGNNGNIKMQEKSKDIKVTITMLVSNRKDTIRKCMDSIKPILEQVPSELIVVDTGSTDGSMDIVREYTDRIVKFEWCNDFSKARNAGLEGACGEWVMSLDDDEWFDDVSEIVDFFNTGEYKHYNRAIYVARNYADLEGRDWSDSNACRMVKRFPDTCYTGRVHEFIGPLMNPTKYFDAFVHHYGYAFQSEEEHRKHAGRNISLMEIELAESPEDMRIIPQMVQECFSLKETDRVLELCRRGMDIHKRTGKYAPGAGYCYVFSIRAYMVTEEWDKAYRWGKDMLEKGAPTNMALLGAVREMVTVCKQDGKYREGLNCLHKYCELYDVLTEKVDRDEIYLGMSKYLRKEEREYAYMEGIALGILAKDPEAANTYFYLKDWNVRPLMVHPDTLDYVMELWAECGFRQEYADALGKIVANPPFYKQITENMRKYGKEDPQGCRNLLYLFAVCQDTSPYTNRYRLDYYSTYGEGTGHLEMQRLAGLLWEGEENPLLWEHKFWTLLTGNGLTVTEYIRNTGLTEWFTQVRGWLEVCVGRGADWDEAYGVSYCGDEPGEMHFRFLELKHGEGMMRRKLSEQGAERMDSRWLLECLDGFYSGMWEFFARIYREEMFEYGMATVLPPEAAFAVYIRLAVQRRQAGDNDAYPRMLLKAAECYPPMKEWCKALLQKEKEERLSGRSREEETEFRILAGRMKQKVRELLDAGSHEAARQLILQLEKLLPGDAELAALGERIP